ncbi:N-acetyl sugar amidotransferase [Falsiruegeria litorea]|nr:N-acetyl sugar amidotransferase [Falsiruegeria litorea]
MGTRYQICAQTVMDTSDPDIVFDADGVSNYVHDFEAFRITLPDTETRDRQLAETLAEIKRTSQGKTYDCVLGLSGGVDSSYMAWLAKDWGLNPLVVHFDNGWNSELAVNNIEEIVTRLGFDLETLVMDWEEFRDLQRAYFKASVVDIEVCTDQLIQGALYRLAARHGIRAILSGTNWATEWLMPPSWNYRKQDLVNLYNIHRQFGNVPLRKSTTYGLRQQIWYTYVKGIKTYDILNLVEYSKARAKEVLIQELGWRDYGGKHYESVFTRFYQGHVLPQKFDIDKRRAHLSNLILTGEITRDEALRELQQPTYDEELQAEDKAYVGKKLGFSTEEFDAILSAGPVPHAQYGTDLEQRKRFMAWVTRLSKTRNALLGRKPIP